MELNFKKIYHELLIIGLTLIGLLLRLSGLSIGLWRDEGVTYFCSTLNTMKEVVDAVVYSELSPPGFHLLMYQWIKWFGTSEVALKTPALIFGLLLIPTIYYLGKIIYSRQVGLFAAIFATFAPEAIYYSQEVRPYSLSVLLSSLVIIFYCKILISEHKLSYWIAFIVFADLLLYVHYTGFLLIGSLALVTGLLIGFKIIKIPLHHFVIAFATIFIIFSPWLPNFLVHLSTGTPWEYPKPWLTRIELFRQNIVYTFPIINYNQKVYIKGKSILGLIILLFLVKELISISFLSRRLSDTKNKLLTVYTVPYIAVIYCLFSSLLMMVFLSRSGRYMLPFAPMAWVIYGTWLTQILQCAKRHTTQKIFRFCQWMVIILMVLFLIIPNSLYPFFRLSKVPKSGIKTIAEVWDVGSHINDTFYLLSPDYLASTFDYYFAQYPVQYYGFARWESPENFTPKNYDKVWNDPDLLSEIEHKIKQKKREGFKNLVLIQESGKLKNSGKMEYSQANKLLEQLKTNYPLVDQKSYRGRNETVTFYLFSISESSPSPNS